MLIGNSGIGMGLGISPTRFPSLSLVLSQLAGRWYAASFTKASNLPYWPRVAIGNWQLVIVTRDSVPWLGSVS